MSVKTVAVDEKKSQGCAGSADDSIIRLSPSDNVALVIAHSFIMTPTQPSLTGTLSLYQLPNSDWQRRPYFTSADTTADRAVVFIGGLHVGLFDTPFLVPVSRALEDAKWRLYVRA